MNEFDIIDKYFLPLTQERAEAGALLDDAAVFKIPEGRELVVSSDTLNAGVHFIAHDNPDYIAHKVLRVNLSDLAAMGADPLAYQMNIAFTQKPDEEWLKKFTGALFADQKEFGIFCSGGDTTTTNGPLSVCITALGTVPQGKAVRRSGAKPDDVLMLSGPVGDAWIGLQCLTGKISVPDELPFLEAYRKPRPEIRMVKALRQYAHAAIDISDGLVADLAHICKASGCAVDVDIQDDMFSMPALALLEQGLVRQQDLLTGGDDYRLLFAVSANDLHHFEPYGAIRIGRFRAGPAEVKIYDKSGIPLALSSPGWTHF